MPKPTSGLLTDFVYAKWKQADDCNAEDLAIYDVNLRTNEVERQYVRNHGRIVDSKVMRPETYDLKFKYYLLDADSEPMQGTRSTPLPKSYYSLTFETEFGRETLQDGRRVGEPVVSHQEGIRLVSDKFRFQKRS